MKLCINKSEMNIIKYFKFIERLGHNPKVSLSKTIIVPFTTKSLTHDESCANLLYYTRCDFSNTRRKKNTWVEDHTLYLYKYDINFYLFKRLPTLSC